MRLGGRTYELAEVPHDLARRCLLCPAHDGKVLVHEVAFAVKLGRPLLGDVVDGQRRVRRRLRGKEAWHDVVPEEGVRLGQEWLDLPQEQAIGCGRIKDHQARLAQINRSYDALVVHKVRDDSILLCQSRDLLLRLWQEILGHIGRALTAGLKQWAF